MKKIKILVLTILFSLFCLTLITNNIKAYDTSLETSNIPDGYYDSLDMTLSDESFRRNLSEIISANYVSYPYSASSTDVYDILVESDADPSGNGNVICIYTGISLLPSQTNSTLAWDKEHVWAKSHGFPEDGYSSSAPYSDAHHLRPCVASVNRSRGNYDFGELPDSVSADSTYGYKLADNIFEPRDEAKGDVARMMFYMATRYGFDDFALTLTNDTTTTSSALNGKFGNLDTLIKWHYEDPVSTSEIYRNNVIYSYQKNRNPYIDHPEYVDLAYPSEYSDMEIDQTAIDNVILNINELNETITLDDKEAVETCNTLYLALNARERTLVTNYSILEAAIKMIDKLENGSVSTILPYEYTFSKSVFSANGTITLDTLDWTFNGDGTYFGYDSTKGQQFGSASSPNKAMSLTSTTLDNVSKITIETSGASSIAGTMTVKVGDTSIGNTITLTSTNTEYIFEHSEIISGEISLNYSQTSSKAIYIKSIKIEFASMVLVTFDANGGTFVDGIESTKTTYDSVVLPQITDIAEAPYKYMVLTGFSDGINTYNPGDEVYVSVDTTFTAIYEVLPNITVKEALEVAEITGTTNTLYKFSTIAVVSSIVTEYSDTYDNISIKIKDTSTDTELLCYRLLGGADLKVNDTIKVTGYIINYYGNTPEYVTSSSYVTIDSSVYNFISETTSSSLKIEYNDDLVATDVDIRFGGIISESSYNQAAKYGVIILASQYDYKLSFATDSALNLVGEGYFVECSPVMVNDGYQFAWVITNMEDHYDYEFIAVMYMEFAGNLYLANSTNNDIISLAKYYVDNNMVSDSNIITVIRSIYE